MPSLSPSQAIIAAVETQIHKDTGANVPMDLSKPMAFYNYSPAGMPAFLAAVAGLLQAFGYPSRCAYLNPNAAANDTIGQLCGYIASVTP